MFVNLVDFDMLYGHRNDVAGFARALQSSTPGCRAFEAALGPGDLAFITADHGNDPTTPGTDHTREYVPLLAFGPGRARRRRSATRDLVLRHRPDDRRRARPPAARPRHELPRRDRPVKATARTARRPVLIARKRDGGALSDGEIRAFIAGAAAARSPTISWRRC